MNHYKTLAVAEYSMQERDKNLRNLTITKVVADAAIGVICEWRETGDEYLDKGNKIRIANPVRTISGCVMADEVPVRWGNENKSMIISQMSGKSGIFSNADRLDKFLEISIPNPDSSGRSLNLTREWDISTKEVCLTTSELQDGQSVFRKKWGCFPVRNHAYFEKIVKRIGISPEL